MVCFAAKSDTVERDWSDAHWDILLNGDSFCLLEDAHEGEHEWTHQGRRWRYMDGGV